MTTILTFNITFLMILTGILTITTLGLLIYSLLNKRRFEKLSEKYLLFDGKNKQKLTPEKIIDCLEQQKDILLKERKFLIDCKLKEIEYQDAVISRLVDQINRQFKKENPDGNVTFGSFSTQEEFYSNNKEVEISVNVSGIYEGESIINKKDEEIKRLNNIIEAYSKPRQGLTEVEKIEAYARHYGIYDALMEITKKPMSKNTDPKKFSEMFNKGVELLNKTKKSKRGRPLGSTKTKAKPKK